MKIERGEREEREERNRRKRNKNQYNNQHEWKEEKRHQPMESQTIIEFSSPHSLFLSFFLSFPHSLRERKKL